jgi:hypothetical protein
LDLRRFAFRTGSGFPRPSGRNRFLEENSPLDGFGFHCVETARAIDCWSDAKDYGGFSIMTEQSRREITGLVFGEEGLKCEKALKSLGLITSPGFYAGGYENRRDGSHAAAGIQKLREKRPDPKAWVTSTSRGRMNAKFFKEIWGPFLRGEGERPHPLGRNPAASALDRWSPQSGLCVQYNEAGIFEVRNREIAYDAPVNSATAFFAEEEGFRGEVEDP